MAAARAELLVAEKQSAEKVAEELQAGVSEREGLNAELRRSQEAVDELSSKVRELEKARQAEVEVVRARRAKHAATISAAQAEYERLAAACRATALSKL